MTADRYQSPVGTGLRPESVPTGIVVLCLLRGLSAAFGAMFALRVLVDDVGVGMSPTVLAGGLLVLALFEFVVVYGLLTLREWGWVLGVLTYAAAVLLQFGRGNFVGMVMAVLSIAYLAHHEDTYRGGD